MSGHNLGKGRSAVRWYESGHHRSETCYDRKVGEVEIHQLRALVKEREAQVVTRGTRVETVTVLRSMLWSKQEQNEHHHSPAAARRAKQDVGRRRASIPMLEDVKRVADVTGHELARLWLLTMAYTDARPLDALRRRWEHVERDRQAILVGSEPVASAGSEREIRTRGMTRAGPPARSHSSARWCRSSTTSRCSGSPTSRGTSPFAPSRPRRPIEVHALITRAPFATIIRRTCTEIGVVVKPNDVRHVNASLMIKSGMLPFNVSRIVGYGSVEATSRIYGHLMAGALDEARQRIERELDGA